MEKYKAKQTLSTLLIHITSYWAFVSLHQLATTWTKASFLGPKIHNIFTLIAQELADDMLVKGSMPTDMVLLYGWVRGGGGGSGGFNSGLCLPHC